MPTFAAPYRNQIASYFNQSPSSDGMTFDQDQTSKVTAGASAPAPAVTPGVLSPIAKSLTEIPGLDKFTDPLGGKIATPEGYAKYAAPAGPTISAGPQAAVTPGVLSPMAAPVANTTPAGVMATKAVNAGVVSPAAPAITATTPVSPAVAPAITATTPVSPAVAPAVNPVIDKPSLYIRQPTGSINWSGLPGGAMKPTGIGTQRVQSVEGQYGADQFNKDVASVAGTPGAKNVKALFIPGQHYQGDEGPGMGPASTIVVSDPNNRLGRVSNVPAPLSPEAQSNLISKVGGGGVLQATPQEVDTLRRMTREGAPGSRSTRDINAQAAGVGGALNARDVYDAFGRTAANEAQARNIAMQGEVNKGVLAQQQGKRDIAEIVANSKVDAKEKDANARVESAKIVSASKLEEMQAKGDIAKAGLAIKERQQKWIEEHGVDSARQLARTHYVEERDKLIAADKDDQVPALNAMYKDILTPEDIKVGRKTVQAQTMRPAPVKGGGVAQSWQQAYGVAK